MHQKNFSVRTMTRQELTLARQWAITEGWNPGIHEANCFYATDPNGFLIGMLDDEPIASLSVVKYGESFGFLGFYIVKPEHRGKGYGMQIWNAGMIYLEGRTIGLDGVIDQQSNYQKSGFELAYRNLRFQGLGGGVVSKDPAILDLSHIPLEQLFAYDRAFYLQNRSIFLKCWIQQAESAAIGIMHQQQLVGYGAIRRCHNGYKIGPLFADNVDFAERLFNDLKARVPSDTTIFMDIPELNTQALDLASRHAMVVSFETARMYKGIRPELPMEKIFGVTSLELG
ncbi:MAG: GNAT family N-acetyltransferase [Arenimonas sp.]|nr:GNAT family N-acetyltransferase [Arenimonas sp.]